MRLTIGLKVFGIAVGLLALMAGASFLTVRMAGEVEERLDLVVEDYLPAYAHVARANIRSLEQGAHLRQLFAAQLDRRADRATTERLTAAIAEADRAADTEIAGARARIADRLARGEGFGDSVALARLEARLDALDERRDEFGALAARLAEAVAKGDRGLFDRLMPEFDAARDRLDARLEGVRVELLRLTEAAAAEADDSEHRVVAASAVTIALAALLGLVLAGAVSHGITRPVRRLMAGAEAVEAGRLDTVVAVSSRDEIGRLTESFNRMVGELRDKQRIRDIFGAYIDPRVVAELIDRPALSGVEGERRPMTVMFADLKGFTSLSEGMTPTALVRVINEYFAEMSAAVRERQGVVDKYIGDAVMAFWGPPFAAAADEARLACETALAQLARLDGFRARLPEIVGIKRGLPEIDMRIGIASGDVLCGSIGSAQSKSFTVMGDAVNLASRLEGANKLYGTRILVSARTAALVGAAVETREIDAIVVKGRSEPERIFEVLAGRGALDDDAARLRERYAEGLALYRRRDWAAAERAFMGCLEIRLDDGPTRAFLARVRDLAARPPEGEWNGVYIAAEK